MPKILVIEDEKAIQNVLKNIIEDENASYKVEQAFDGKEGLEKILQNTYDMVLCDIKMPKLDGIDVLEKALEQQTELPFIMISGHGDIETAVDCIKKGAYDFISKPPDLNRLLNAIRNGLDKKSLVVENKTLKKKVNKKYEMIGESDAILRIKDMIERVANTDARVLVTGENGTGKELIAHWLHEKSNRSNSPMIEVNCAAIPSELIESELFGHEKGSFTSAVKQRKGKFELADGGTLFLDEIGDMSLSAQAKVLRALQEHKITRVGGDKEISVNVRVIAATNKNLKKEIEAGNFREDLYHRLSVILMNSPALRDRKEDIPLLAEYFVAQICEEHGKSPVKFTPKAMEEMKSYPWTGNIREFRNVIERLIILCGTVINDDDVKTFCKR